MRTSCEAQPTCVWAQRVGVRVDPPSPTFVSPQKHHAPGSPHLVVGLHVPALQDGAGGGTEGRLGVVGLVELWLLVGRGVVGLGVRVRVGVRQGVGVVGWPGVGRRPATAVEEAGAGR